MSDPTVIFSYARTQIGRFQRQPASLRRGSRGDQVRVAGASARADAQRLGAVCALA